MVPGEPKGGAPSKGSGLHRMNVRPLVPKVPRHQDSFKGVSVENDRISRGEPDEQAVPLPAGIPGSPHGINGGAGRVGGDAGRRRTLGVPPPNWPVRGGRQGRRKLRSAVAYVASVMGRHRVRRGRRPVVMAS